MQMFDLLRFPYGIQVFEIRMRMDRRRVRPGSPVSLQNHKSRMINIVSETDDVIVFEMRDSSAESAVELRNRFNKEVFVLAIERVFIHANDGILPDTMIAHRLGLIPVIFGDRLAVKGRYRAFSECVCEGLHCERCSVQFSLTVESDSEYRYVRSHEMKSSDPRVKLMEDIPISVLTGKGQKLSIVAYAVIGRSETKFQAVAPLVWFTVPSVVRINPSRRLTVDQLRDFVDVCPTKVFYVKNDRIVIRNQNDCIRCNECLRKSHDFRDSEDDLPVVSVSYDPCTFIFTVESAGQLKAREIFNEVFIK